MADYLFRNSRGEERLITASMTDVPPETITVNDDGSWVAVPAKDPLAFKRVYLEAQARVGRSFPYVSKANIKHPLARECEKAKITVGSQFKREIDAPIIRSAEHEAYLAKKYGMTVE